MRFLKAKSCLLNFFSGPFTLFAPYDHAFARLGPSFNQYTSVQLKRLLEYHIHPGFLLVAMVEQKDNYSTMVGEQLEIEPVSNVGVDTFTIT